MGVVYLAYNIKTHGNVAIKEIDRSRFKDNPAKIQEVIDEAALLGRISYPAIPRVINVMDDPEAQYLYIIQDYIAGKTLAEAVIDRAKVKAKQGVTDQYKQKQLSHKTIVSIAKQLIDTFIYLHTRQEPVLYRDLKPGNVMIDRSNNIHLIDFGIAFPMTQENLQQGVKIGMGTKGYAAPEQFGNTPYHTLQTDIFNFGRLLYELATGYCPAPKYVDEKGRTINNPLPPIKELRPDIDEALEEIIQTCMEVKLEDRYGSFTEVKYAFDHYHELGPSFKARAVNRIKTVAITGIISAVLLTSGVGLLAYDKVQASVAYENMLEQVDVYNNVEEVVQLIEKNPAVVKPYKRLIELYKVDDVFTLDEEQQLLKLITKNLSTLMKKDGFGDLAYDIGETYFYYYKATEDEKQNSQLQMAQSVQWFGYALDTTTERTELANIYYNLGLFNRDIVLAIKQGEDVGLYKGYFETLDSLITTLDLENTPDLMKLRLIETVQIASDQYAEAFKKDGVTDEAFTQLLQQTINLLDAINPKSDMNKEKKQQLNEAFTSKIGG